MCFLMSEVGSRISDVGCGMWDVGFWNPEPETRNPKLKTTTLFSQYQ